MHFSDFGLAEEILRAVTERGYTTPTPIQAKAIPIVMEGNDLLAGAQTGTGKTAGFVLPILQRLSKIQPKRRRPIRALVVTPTRELAAQVEASVRDYGRYLPLRSMTIFGGVGFNPQADKLRRGVDILVATPGRLLDHMNQGTIDLSQVEVLVLDEADRMLDMGFIKDIKRILKMLPEKRQNLLFSATFSSEIRELAQKLLDNPATVEAPRENLAADTVSQTIHPVDRHRKRELLSHLVKENNWYQVLVFARTKHGSDRLVKQLGQDGINAAAIHGNKSQNARTRALANFKQGKTQVLVATDIAARGIDIVDLPYVVNFDLPNVSEDYVHRIGRTGRAGATGQALSLVAAEEFKLLYDIEKLINRKLPRTIVPGFEPQEGEPRRPGTAHRRPSNSRKRPGGGNNSSRRSNSHGKSGNRRRGNRSA